MKYIVTGKTNVMVNLEVEADTEEGAMEFACKELGSLTAFVGNGGSDKLVGVSLQKAHIDPSDEIEWIDAHLIGEI